MAMGKGLGKVSKCAKVVNGKPDLGRIPGKGCRNGNGGFPLACSACSGVNCSSMKQLFPHLSLSLTAPTGCFASLFKSLTCLGSDIPCGMQTVSAGPWAHLLKLSLLAVLGGC